MLNSRRIKKALLLGAINLLAREEAASGADTTAVNSGSAESLQEVVVTAQRREESLQSVPVAVSAISANQLESLSVTSLSTLDQSVPNMISGGGLAGGNGGQFFLRGVGQVDYVGTTDPGVGLYVDGVYLGRTQGANLDLIDMDRVEVLRGPQGTLYGRNAIGGVINYISKRPSADEETQVSMGVMARNGVRGQFTTDLVAIPDRVFVRASFLGTRQNGFSEPALGASQYSSQGLGKGTFGDNQTAAGRISILYSASEILSFLLEGDLSRATGSASANILLGAGPNLLGGASGKGPVALSPQEAIHLGDPTLSFNDYRGPSTNNAAGGALTIDAHLSEAVALKAITAYRTLYQDTGLDFDGTPANLSNQAQTLNQWQFSEELQAYGKLLDKRLSWLVGLYYLNERFEQHITLDGRFADAINVFSFTGGEVLDEKIDQKTRNLGIYSTESFHLTDRLSVTVGGRFTHEAKDGLLNFRVFPSIDVTGVPLATLVPAPEQSPSASWNSATPKASLDYKFHDDFLAYVSYSEGFRSGGFNGRPFSGVTNSYGPEKLKTYEGGIKSQWFERRVRANLAVFHSSYNDIQVLGLNGGLVETTNAATAKIDGAELELSALPVSDLRIDASAGYLNGKITNTTAVAQSFAVFAGNRLPDTPRWNTSVAADYTVHMAASELVFHVDNSYKSTFYFFPDNAPLSKDAWHLTNARLTWRPNPKLTLAGYCRNIFNSTYFTAVSDQRANAPAGYALAIPGDVRTWGIEARYQF
jgi:iron complex outermembrane receptor protein